MKRIEVNPKNGWAHATKEEMQKESANMLAEKYCLIPQRVYDIFTTHEIDIQLSLPKLIKPTAETVSLVLNVVLWETEIDELKNYLSK